MILLKNVEMFVKYDGQSDAFVRAATPDEKALLPDDVARQIEDIIMHLSLANAGSVSSSYASETEALTNTNSIEPSGLLLLASFVASKQASGRAQA